MTIQTPPPLLAMPAFLQKRACKKPKPSRMVVEPIKKQRREKPVTIIEMDSVKDHPDRIDLCKIKWNDSIVAIPFKPIDFSKNIKDDNNELIVIPIKGDI